MPTSAATPNRWKPRSLRPQWSIEARDFIEAQDLQPGSHVLGSDGIYEVARIEHLAEPIEVFNLEIFGEYVYQITTVGMLMHNAGAGGSGSDNVWQPIRLEIQQRPIRMPVTYQIQFAGGRFTTRSGSSVIQGTYRIDTSTTPPQIAFDDKFTDN